MTPAELREDVGVELEALEAIVQELLSLQADVADREPTVREQTAAAAFLAQFYTGVENILKRISACRCCSMRLWQWRWRRIAVSATWPGIAMGFSSSGVAWSRGWPL